MNDNEKQDLWNEDEIEFIDLDGAGEIEDSSASFNGLKFARRIHFPGHIRRKVISFALLIGAIVLLFQPALSSMGQHIWSSQAQVSKIAIIAPTSANACMMGQVILHATDGRWHLTSAPKANEVVIVSTDESIQSRPSLHLHSFWIESKSCLTTSGRAGAARGRGVGDRGF
jgi:hypothetical protein